MSRISDQEVIAGLNDCLKQPSLEAARRLEHALESRFRKTIFGRINQKSSIEAASESDRGAAERMANAFDATLTAARLMAGVAESDRALTPRNCAQRFLSPNVESCEWVPQDARLESLRKPVIEFFLESEGAKHRFRKYNPGDGLATVLVRDFGLGISREDMPKTILDLNSDSKLRQFEAIGQFGHGGSSSLAFCESCLIVTKPRFARSGSSFYWTLIIPERETGDTKQTLVRRWFCDDQELPLEGSLQDTPCLTESLPGTSIWHFGYNRGGWIKRIAGSEQTNPWGRFSRLFFSYPLPLEIRGELARTDTPKGERTIKGAFFRLVDRSKEKDFIEYRSPEKSETLIVAGQEYGTFSLFAFVMKDRNNVRDYVEKDHPLIITLNGQNHGEMTRTVLVRAGLPELASSSIIEVRLDGLDEEALNEIVTNSREMPKTSDFTRVLQERIIALLAADETMQALELKRLEAKAKQASAELSDRMTQFLSRILSDATTQPVPGEKPTDTPDEPDFPTPLPEVPAADPPTILEFLRTSTLFVAEGKVSIAKFKSDARPPKYSFHGDNPRCFVRFETTSTAGARVSIAGKADINDHGYGSISLSVSEEVENPILERIEAGELVLLIQCTNGETLQTRLKVGVRPKPEPKEKKRRQVVKTRIIFCAEDEGDRPVLSTLFIEPDIAPFGVFLERYKMALEIPGVECAYWGEKSGTSEGSVLSVEINAANPQLRRLLESCRSAEERVIAKERYVRDLVLDCYQHSFALEELPRAVYDALSSETPDKTRAAEIHLNHDKAIRMVTLERTSRIDRIPAEAALTAP
jgi:hypothetical protein